VEARRMAAVQLPMAAVRLPTVVAQLLMVVVVAVADRIIDPGTFPKGSPFLRGGPLAFLGPCLLSKSPATTLQWFACSTGSFNPGVSKFDKASSPSPGCSSESVIV